MQKDVVEAVLIVSMPGPFGKMFHETKSRLASCQQNVRLTRMFLNRP